MANISTYSELDFSLLLPTKLSVAEKLAVSAARIALHYFEWRYVTLVVFNSMVCGIEVFIKMYNKSVIITNNGESNPHSCENKRQYIIFGTNVTDIVHSVQQLNWRKFDNTGKFIVVCDSEINEDCDEQEMLETFWIYKITNMVFIKSESDQINGYTYYLQKHDCTSIRVVRINNIDLDIGNEKIHIAFSARFRNLNKCPITVSTFIQPPYMTITDGIPKGVDGDLLLIIAQKLNASLKMMTPTRGDGWGAFIDGNWTGSLADVYSDLANFSMTFPAITLKRFTDFQMSVNYNFASLVWITHPKETAPSSLKLLHPFQKSTLFVLAITFIFVIVSAIFTRSKMWIKCSRKMNMAHPRSSLVFYSWMICMGMPTPKFPKKTAFLYITLIWIWYGFLIRTFYQASLINSLKTNVLYSNFETVYDFIKAEYPIGGGAALKDYYIEEPAIYDRWINMKSSEIMSNITAISNGRKFGLALNRELAITFLRKRRGDLFILPQKIVVSPTAIFFRKFSPLAAPVDRILSRLIEAGIPMQLYNSYSPKLAVAPDTEQNRSPIKLEHYTGCYVILIIGWVWSLLILNLEICCERNIINTHIFH